MLRLVISWGLCILACQVCAKEPSALIFDTGYAVPSVNEKPVLQLYVKLADKISVGKTDDGERFIVPITGGHFIGKHNIKGEVMSGGADWQVQRADGVKNITAIYSIKTDDGTVITVDNRGIVLRDGSSRYARTVPKFHAPEGKYDWLNKRMFTGSIESMKAPRAVIIRVYELM
jgi:hypothetical protein